MDLLSPTHNALFRAGLYTLVFLTSSHANLFFSEIYRIISQKTFHPIMECTFTLAFF